MKRLIMQPVRSSFEMRLNVSEEIRHMDHVQRIVENSKNEVQAIDNNL
jgi:hypothetical protein